jgi:hypothetical protein
MTRTPDFEDIVGADVGREERERLARVHELLVVAGPPPELPPELELGPTLGMTLAGRRSHRRGYRRIALLAAAFMVLLLAFLAGYIAANSGSAGGGRTLRLVGTAQAPHALAALHVDPVDTAGNWPMTISATGLPKLPKRSYYEVFLTRNGKIYAPCGSFLVKSASGAVSVKLNAPYDLRSGDGWVVTKQLAGDHAAGPIVLKQLSA